MICVENLKKIVITIIFINCYYEHALIKSIRMFIFYAIMTNILSTANKQQSRWC
jgi:hypothetical protein